MWTSTLPSVVGYAHRYRLIQKKSFRRAVSVPLSALNRFSAHTELSLCWPLRTLAYVGWRSNPYLIPCAVPGRSRYPTRMTPTFTKLMTRHFVEAWTQRCGQLLPGEGGMEEGREMGYVDRWGASDRENHSLSGVLTHCSRSGCPVGGAAAACTGTGGYDSSKGRGAQGDGFEGLLAFSRTGLTHAAAE